MARVVVLGATGMAGHVISQYLEERGHDVYRTSRSIEASTRAEAIDAADVHALIAWLDFVRPAHVINAIGVLPRDVGARPDLAVLLNAYLPQKLAQYYKSQKTRLIHLSTDCVFAGTKGSYAEDDPTDGMSMYDRSKALGEIRNDKDLTFRMSIIGPDLDVNGVGLFNWFMKQSGEILGYRKAIWNGVTTIELAKGLEAAIQQNLTGLYHFVPDTSISKYELLRLLQSQFHKTDVAVVAHDEFRVDKTLINRRKDLDYQIPSYPVMVHEMAEWILAHKESYGYG